MNTTISSENETTFHFILNVTRELRVVSKRPDNQALLDNINKTSAKKMGLNHTDDIVSSTFEKQMIYDKP